MIKSLIFTLKGILLALLNDLRPAIERFFRLLCKTIRAFCDRRDRPHVVNPASCIPIKHPAYRKPDPLIYDQYYLMSLGLAVTWENPDIQILLGGVPVASAYDLAPATAYTIRARIWNGSTGGVCAGMPVRFSYLSFGVGTVSHYIGTTSVDLGVKGSPQSPTFTDMVWVTPAAPGHYCIQVSFLWLDDANPFNNLGQTNTQVVKALSPAPFSFTLRNAGDVRRDYRFEVDTFQLPPPPPCPEAGGNGNKPGDVAEGRAANGKLDPATLARNSRAANPLPAGWTITFNPAAPVLIPGEEVEIAATVDPDNNFHGTQPLNIHTFSGNELVGGVTITVERV
jgi:hypothetical protein